MSWRAMIAWWLLTSACTSSRPLLDDANEIRLDAVVELTAVRARSVICLSIDPRSGSAASPVGSEPFARVQDPEGALFQAVSRLGVLYPGSRCQPGDAIGHPGGSDRSGIFVTLGAVNLSADGKTAHLLAAVSQGALMGEVRRLTYRREGDTWRLSSNALLMQE